MIDPARPDYANTPASPQRPRFGYAPEDAAAAPAVTIVTPFYNTGEVFYETALSVLRQSLQQWEWLIINDGSTDPAALAILDQYRQRDPRIRVIDHPQNKGLSAARNSGFAAARTPFVVQLDSDDLLETTAVEKWFWFLLSFPQYGFVKGFSVGFGAEQYLWRDGFQRGRDFTKRNWADPPAMIRRAVHQAVGGFDETMRDGLEDWDFWLRCANAGHWGATVPEFLNWYRRRPSHGDRWQNLSSMEQVFAFRDTVLRQRYPRLWQRGGFPSIVAAGPTPYGAVPDDLPLTNRLRKDSRRLLMLVPWLTMGGADKFNLDLVRGLRRRGWEITIAATLPGDNPWLATFARETPDIFILPHFLHLKDFPRFLRYLIQSRQPEALLITGSELGYWLTPYLRAHFPHSAFLDYCHIEEMDWKDGGYPRFSTLYHDLFDRTGVTSEHLRRWMMKRGASAEKVETCYINVDSDAWQPDATTKAAVHRELEIAEDTPIILYAARLVPQKQPETLAATLLELRRRGESFVLVVAGSGPKLAWLRSYIDKHRLHDQVRTLGAVPEAQMQRLMAAADIFFLPSQWEGIALTFYEALACGVPVVGADVGGQRELATPDCAVLLPRADETTEAKQYAAVLAELLADPERRQRMGAAGRQRVIAHFRLEGMIGQMAALIDAALAARIDNSCPIPNLAMGRVAAIQAVELTQQANELAWLRQRPHVVRSIPEPLLAPFKRVLRSLIWPNKRLEPLIDFGKRFVPLRLKIFLKRSVM